MLKEKELIKYSKEVGTQLEKQNIIFLLSLGLIDFFKVLTFYPEDDSCLYTRIEYWSQDKDYAQKGKCIFSMRHPNSSGTNLMYLSSLSEKELLQLISLRMFW